MTALMDGVRCDVTCPRCGGPLAPVALGRPTDLGTRTTGIVRCPRCRGDLALTVTLRPLDNDRRTP